MITDIKKFFLFSVLLSLTIGLSVPVVFAQDYRQGANTQLDAFAGERGANLGAPNDPRAVAARVIKVALSLLGMLFLIYTLYAGYVILMARGDEDEVTKGKETLRTAVIGLLIILASYSITLLVARIATEEKSTVEPIFDDEGDGWRVRPNPADFMPTDPLR